MVNREIDLARHLLRMYANFVERLPVLQTSLHMNLVALLDASKRYWLDVDRLHHYHNIEKIDCHKIAGYLTYWITKIKPISVLDVHIYSERLNELLLNINEYYAFYIAVGRIIDNRKQLNRPNRSPILTGNFVKALIYSLKYRTTTGDNLSLIYYLLDADDRV